MADRQVTVKLTGGAPPDRTTLVRLVAEYADQSWDKRWDLRLEGPRRTYRLCVLWGENYFSHRKGFRRLIGGWQYRAEFDPKHTLTVFATRTRSSVWDRKHKVWLVK